MTFHLTAADGMHYACTMCGRLRYCIDVCIEVIMSLAHAVCETAGQGRAMFCSAAGQLFKGLRSGLDPLQVMQQTHCFWSSGHCHVSSQHCASHYVSHSLKRARVRVMPLAPPPPGPLPPPPPPPLLRCLRPKEHLGQPWASLSSCPTA